MLLLFAITSRPLIQNRSCGDPAEDPGKKTEPARSDGVVSLSRAEAKQAWLAEGSDLERAARQALRERFTKVRDTAKRRLIERGKENLD